MPPNYKCERCQRSFTTKSGLGVHKANSTLCEYTDWIVDQYKRGYSAREIAEMMDVDAAHQSIRRIVDDLEVKRSKSEANEMAWDKGFFDAPDPDLEITEDLAWLVGVLLGDGSVYKAASKEYVIALGVIDKPFADEFARVLESIGLTASRYYDEDHHPNPVHQVRACSKKFYEWWQNRPVAKIASKHPAAFIRGIYDSEGSLRSRGPNSWSISISMQDGWILRSVRASTPMPHFGDSDSHITLWPQREQRGRRGDKPPSDTPDLIKHLPG